jgi:ubiquinone/menaquinone biosynthesis C-methylase UbiE
MKIDIGGGKYCKEGYINVDLITGTDLNKDRLPFEDSTIDEIYSSHCLEHLKSIKHILNEIVRVGKNDATIEIRTPHFTNPMAMCLDHIHVMSEQVWENMLIHFITDTFDTDGRIKIDHFEYKGFNIKKLPDFDYPYYHEFAMIGRVVK